MPPTCGATVNPAWVYAGSPPSASHSTRCAGGSHREILRVNTKGSSSLELRGKQVHRLAAPTRCSCAALSAKPLKVASFPGESLAHGLCTCLAKPSSVFPATTPRLFLGRLWHPTLPLRDGLFAGRPPPEHSRLWQPPLPLRDGFFAGRPQPEYRPLGRRRLSSLAPCGRVFAESRSCPAKFLAPRKPDPASTDGESEARQSYPGCSYRNQRRLEKSAAPRS